MRYQRTRSSALQNLPNLREEGLERVWSGRRFLELLLRAVDKNDPRLSLDVVEDDEPASFPLAS
jgi:hypothetical protein